MKLNKHNRTILPKIDEVERKWWLIDAHDVTLGKIATKIAQILRGKDKTAYTPFFDTGDFVIIINAEKIKVTGNKKTDKIYYRHSGYPGGIKETSFAHMLDKHPDRIIRQAVKGMLPKNRLNRKILKKLKIYAGSEHNHKAQKPEVRTV